MDLYGLLCGAQIRTNNIVIGDDCHLCREENNRLCHWTMKRKLLQCIKFQLVEIHVWSVFAYSSCSSMVMKVLDMFKLASFLKCKSKCSCFRNKPKLYHLSQSFLSAFISASAQTSHNHYLRMCLNGTNNFIY